MERGKSILPFRAFPGSTRDRAGYRGRRERRERPEGKVRGISRLRNR